ncbi:uncharacterized protein LOC110093222 [Dendrobium catenatum]|uniref:uncharacterized protein LOC110093222 n=1 Tax=Dendrobium catenatum TaxID=906689 RepID=UPI0010A042F2|nr:uncharacterized protein LOC110093222 [Dendrobium catenatum]
MERLFSKFDMNCDGKISVSELQLLMRAIGEEFSCEDMETLLQFADSDGTALLDIDDFMRLVGVENSTEEDLMEAFKLYGVDGQDCITARSLKRMLSSLGASSAIEDCETMICQFDLNGDGVLCFEEFKAMMLLRAPIIHVDRNFVAASKAVGQTDASRGMSSEIFHCMFVKPLEVVLIESFMLLGPTSSLIIIVLCLRIVCVSFLVRLDAAAEVESKHSLLSSPFLHLFEFCKNKIIGMDMTSISFANAQKDMERLFNHFDTNGDGKISSSELQLIMRTIGEELCSEEAEAMLRYVDSDDDGLLGMEDFIRLVETESSEEEKSNKEDHIVKEAFKLYEMDGKGFITDRSLKRMLSHLGSSRPIEQCRSMIASFDLNRDGVICIEEFRAMMML